MTKEIEMKKSTINYIDSFFKHYACKCPAVLLQMTKRIGETLKQLPNSGWKCHFADTLQKNLSINEHDKNDFEISVSLKKQSVKSDRNRISLILLFFLNLTFNQLLFFNLGQKLSECIKLRPNITG